MANVIKKATNRFTKGLVMDFSPENTKNEVLTHALNATLLTFNGNEMSLQNDMGNARVETTYLPEGYMPVGTCEYGGIIYIVSYNPLENKSLIGCFPSPERNISSDELGISKVHISREDFLELDKNYEPTGVLKHNTQYVLLKNSNLNPGDKFLICSNHEIYSEQLENLLIKKDPTCSSTGVKDKDGYELVENPILTLNVVSIEESGKIIYLNSDIRRYEVPNQNSTGDEECISAYKYHILGTGGKDGEEFNLQNVDIDSYRNALSSGYSVFKSKTSGKLAILAELIMIDSYSVTHSLLACVDNYGNTIDGKFDVILHTEVEPSVTKQNYTLVPKLRYYYLDKSLGYIQYYDSENSEKPINTRSLFEEKNGAILQKRSNLFLNTKLSSIYEKVESVNLEKTLQDECLFNFPYTDTYHGNMLPYDGENLDNETIYTKFTEDKYHRFHKSQILDNIEYFYNNFKFYKYVEGEAGYLVVDKNHTISDEYIYYVKIPISEYVDAQRSTDHKDKELYKLTTSAVVATQKEINDSQIEKFEYLSKVRYEVATDEQLALGKNLWYKSDPESLEFTSLTGAIDPTVTYYVEISERYLVSRGCVIDSDSITGILFYYPTTKNYKKATEEDKNKYYDTVTYPLTPTPPYGSPITLYYQKTDYVYKPATKEQIENSSLTGVLLFFDSNYRQVSDIRKYVDSNLLFMVALVDTYLPYDQFKPSTEYNYINGYNNKIDKYEKDYPLYLFALSDFIPELSDSETYTPYQDLKLGTIQLPSVVYKYGVDLPFKYDYTVVPCMNYGRLDHLAVSNTVDFSKLHAFNRSSFTTWKYRIDDGYLRLTVGAEVFDTYETNKVDGLIFEFYDHRGFAGSFEFVDKKSYNGVFTKVIPLNSLRALSLKMIIDGSLITSYKRNINIIELYTDDYTGKYSFNNLEVKHNNYLEGWNINDSDNDCGTIYSNVIYGVKTYFRRTTKTGVEYVRKQDMFVYTLPLFNEYYYKINNFMTITNPLLQFMLTYKVVDESTKSPYNSSTILQGYNSTNKKQIDEYISGFYNVSQNVTLDLIKYYKYVGNTDLYLEVGLKQDYNDINLAYNPSINEYFTCKLQLISTDDKNTPFNVTAEASDLTDPKSILNYTLNGLNLDINKIWFAENNTTQLEIKNNRLPSCNFISNKGTSPINIKYEFVTGYTINISNIRATNVPATTVCALLHKNASGEYNYEDFGIYELTVDSEPKYLSSQMLYNSGDKNNEIFGICRLITTTGNMLEQCQIQTSVETTAREIKIAGKLNSGEPLKQTFPNIGKLTFCLPHVHGLSEDFGVNVYNKNEMYGTSGTPEFGVAPNTSGGFKVDGGFEVDDHDDCYGIIPRIHLYEKPLYNLSLNTKNAVNYNSEFLSTFLYEEIKNKYVGWDYGENNEETCAESPEVTMRKFTGFTGDEVALFNLKLLETMKSIYAYNPDYDSLQINVGDIILLKHGPKFISNLISSNAKFEFGDTTLNDYIYINNLNLSKYLVDLNTYSAKTDDTILVKNGDKFINHLQFAVDYTYCGTDTSPCLVSLLTYHTPVPIEIEEELTFNKSNLVVIKHHDNTNSFISGNLNKKLLYGYNQDYNKLITLDVSNYTIDKTGKLSLKNTGTLAKFTINHALDKDSLVEYIKAVDGSPAESAQNIEPDWEDKETEPIKVELILNMGLAIYNMDCKKSSKKGVYLQINPVEFVEGLSYYNFTIFPSVKVTGGKQYDYNVYINSITLKVGGCDIPKSTLTAKNINLLKCSEETLDALIYESENKKLSFTTNTNQQITLSSDSVRNKKGGYSKVYVYSHDPKTVSDKLECDPNKTYTVALGNTFTYISLDKDLTAFLLVGLFYIEIENINYTLTRVSKIENEKNDIITFVPTENYSHFLSSLYIIDPKYKLSRIRGTSITLNDLTYEPNISGHRLYMKNDLCQFINTHRGRIFYRNMDKDKDGQLWAKTYEHYNTLYMMTGPCFTTDNLSKDPT